MRSRVQMLPIALILGTTFLSCQSGDRATGGGRKEQAPPNAAAQEPAPHASSKAKPGSHEDWCGEHQVPDSLCTQCNPTLVAAFKATGDWCEEHQLPESQCRICHPDLKIERPPKLVSED